MLLGEQGGAQEAGAPVLSEKMTAGALAVTVGV